MSPSSTVHGSQHGTKSWLTNFWGFMLEPARTGFICIVQILPRKLVLDRADYTGPIRQHELDHARSGIDLP